MDVKVGVVTTVDDVGISEAGVEITFALEDVRISAALVAVVMGVDVGLSELLGVKADDVAVIDGEVGTADVPLAAVSREDEDTIDAEDVPIGADVSKVAETGFDERLVAGSEAGRAKEVES